MLCRAGMMLQANTVGTMRDGMNMHLGASAGQDLGQHPFFGPDARVPGACHQAGKAGLFTARERQVWKRPAPEPAACR